MFVAYSYFLYIIPVPVAIPNTSWLACEVCAEAAVMYDVFGERQRLGLCRQRNSASYSTER